jgi:hypothetical protein
VFYMCCLAYPNDFYDFGDDRFAVQEYQGFAVKYTKKGLLLVPEKWDSREPLGESLIYKDFKAVQSLPARERGYRQIQRLLERDARVAPCAGAWISPLQRLLERDARGVAPCAGAWISPRMDG